MCTVLSTPYTPNLNQNWEGNGVTKAPCVVPQLCVSSRVTPLNVHRNWWAWEVRKLQRMNTSDVFGVILKIASHIAVKLSHR